MRFKKSIKFRLVMMMLPIMFSAVVGIYENIWNSKKSSLSGSIEKRVGDFNPSSGNLYGKIYSLDGVPMLQRLDLETGDNILGAKKEVKAELYSPTERYFAPVIGFDYIAEDVNDNADSDLGLLSGPVVQKILQSNAKSTNEGGVQGNSIVTTIYSPAQEEAIKQLDDLLSSEEAYGSVATLAVVNRDGAILVNAATIPSNQQEFQKENEDGSKAYIENDSENPSYYTSDSNAFLSRVVGSAFKPITARVLEQNEELLSKDSDWSIYNTEFKDYSDVTVDGVYVPNWEIISGSELSLSYTNQDGDRFFRKSDLSAAFINSSNTYFLRHVENLGFEKYKTFLKNKLGLYSRHDIGSAEIDGLEPYGEERFPSGETAYDVNLPFGGDSAIISSLRLASAYNHIVGGYFFPLFDIAQLREPNGKIIYQHMPTENEDYRLEINIAEDIVVKSLSDTFQAYVEDSDESYKEIFEDLPEDLLSSGRLLAKSGTSGVRDSGTESRTMVVTLLNKDKTSVICTAVISVDNVSNGTMTHMSLIYRLLRVIEQLGVYDD